MTIKYTIEVRGVLFGWHNRKLYRVPQMINKRFYPLKELAPIKIGQQYGYRCNGAKLTINQLEALTLASRPIVINKNKSKQLPF